MKELQHRQPHDAAVRCDGAFRATRGPARIQDACGIVLVDPRIRQRIVESGGPELALALEEKGYDFIRVKHGEDATGKD